MANAFDRYSDPSMKVAKNEPPCSFFKVLQKQDEKQLFQWVKDAFEFCREFYKPYNASVQANVALYQGFQYKRGQTREDYDRATYDPQFFPEDEDLITNYAHELTEEIVSSITMYRPSIAVMPANSNELSDVINAEMMKQLIDTKYYEIGYDAKQPQFIRNTKVGGECYYFCTWDENAGPLSPQYKVARDFFGPEKIPLLDKDGKQREENGKPVFIEKPVRLGELKLQMALAEHVFPQPRIYDEDSDWLMWLTFEEVDGLKQKYAHVEDKIEADKGGNWSFFYNRMVDLQKYTTVINFYHKDTEFVPGGFEFRATTETILTPDPGKLTYRHGQLPCERLTDIDIPGVGRGISYLRNTRPLQLKINELRRLVNRNMKLISHPKWVVETGSISKKHLAAMPGIIPVTPGMKPPTLIQFQSTHPEIYQYIKACIDEIRVLSGVHPISQGQPPAGVESGIALNLLREEENKRYNSFVTKYNNHHVKMSQKVLDTMLEKYKPEDQRLIKTLGPQNEWVYKMVSKAMIETPYDVRLQNQSALGDTKAAKISASFELLDRGVVTPDYVQETLNLGAINQSLKELNEPIRTAQYENEQIISGKPCKVLITDDHEKHFKVHMRPLQETRFRDKDPVVVGSDVEGEPGFGGGLMGHAREHAVFMVQQVEAEMKFGQSPSLMKYSQIPGWTLLAKDLFTPVPPPPPEMPPPGQEPAPPPAGAPSESPIEDPASPIAPQGQAPIDPSPLPPNQS